MEVLLIISVRFPLNHVAVSLQPFNMVWTCYDETDMFSMLASGTRSYDRLFQWVKILFVTLCLVQQTSQMRNPHSNPICTPKSFSSRPEWSLYSGDSVMNVINFYSSRIRWPHVTKQKNRLPNGKLNRKYQNTWTKPCPFSRLFRAIFPRNVLKLHSVLL